MPGRNQRIWIVQGHLLHLFLNAIRIGSIKMRHTFRSIGSNIGVVGMYGPHIVLNADILQLRLYNQY